jgi:hypothetical protein
VRFLRNCDRSSWLIDTDTQISISGSTELIVLIIVPHLDEIGKGFEKSTLQW